MFKIRNKGEKKRKEKKRKEKRDRRIQVKNRKDSK